MSAALKRVAYALNQNFTADSESWIEVGDTADERLYLRDLRSVLALAKETAELKRRVRLARVEMTRLVNAHLDTTDAIITESNLDALLDLRRPLPKRWRR